MAILSGIALARAWMQQHSSSRWRARPCDGSIEALKWIGLVAMTLGNVNAYVLDGRVQWLYELGRIAFPLFGFVLAHHLSRPGAFDAMPRLLLRLLPFAFATQVVIGFSNHSLLPLNVLFTLAAAVLIVWLQASGPVTRARLAVLVLLWGATGLLVAFGWLGLLFVNLAWWWCRTARVAWAALAVVACASLMLVNGNGWALAALPLIVAAHRIECLVPRRRWLFYVYGPAHLAVLIALQQWVDR